MREREASALHHHEWKECESVIAEQKAEIERLRRNQTLLFRRLGQRTAERDRLRDGIAEHRAAWGGPNGIRLSSDNERLWALIEDGEDSDQ